MKRQRGFILLPVIMAITLIACIAFLLNREGAVQLEMAASDGQRSVLQYVAEAGAQHASWLARNNGCGADLTIATTSLGDHSYTASVTGSAATTNYTAAADLDTYIYQWFADTDYATSQDLKVQNDLGTHQRTLFRFDLSAIPANSRVNSASARLYLSDNDSVDSVDIYRINSDWTELGATWDSMNDQFDPTVYATILAQPAKNIWLEVNLTSLVQAWVNGGAPNYGIMLIARSDDELSKYNSRESSLNKPWLEVVVSSSSNSNVTISATGTHENGTTRAVSLTDVSVYQPPSGLLLQPGDTLEDAFVRSDRADKNYGAKIRLRVSNIGTEYNSLVRFNKATLPAGAWVRSAKLGLYLQNADAISNAVLDLHQLSRDWVEGDEGGDPPPANGGVTYDDYDGTNSWTTAGGDYVSTPLDSLTIANFNRGWYEWDVTERVQGLLSGDTDYGFLLRASGGTADTIKFISGDSGISDKHPRLILELACECGTACLLPQGSGDAILVVGDDTSVSSNDAFKKALLESWGYTVALIDDSEIQATYDSTVGLYEVAYVSESVDSATLGTKLVSTTIGVVIQEGSSSDEFGISSASASTLGASFTITDASHYITYLLPQDSLQIYQREIGGTATAGSEAAGLQILANWGADTGLAVLDTGGAMDGGGTAAGPRVLLPFGSTDSFRSDLINSNGYLIMQRAIEWAKISGSGAYLCNGNFRDEFNLESYAGSDGSKEWAGDWTEVGEADGATSGDIAVANDDSDFMLQVKDNDNGGEGLQRELNLTGSSSASLSFKKRRHGLDDADDYVTIEISSNGTAGPWTELDRFKGSATDGSYSTKNYDISAYTSATTAIRFLGSADLGPNDRVWFDDVEIQCSP